MAKITNVIRDAINPQQPEWKRVKDKVDDNFEETKEVRNQMEKDLDHFLGKIWNKDELDQYDSEAVINFVFAIIEAQAPLIVDSRPTTRIIPKVPYLMPLAEAYNFGIQYYWDVHEMQDKLFRMVLDAKIKKKGIIKIFKGEERGTKGIQCEVVDPATFFIASGYDDEWDAPMMGERVFMPLSWAKANYPEKAKKIKASTDEGNAKTNKTKFGPEQKSEEDKFVRIYKVWKRDNSEETEEDENGEKKKVKKYPNGKWLIFTDTVLLEETAMEENHGLPPYVGLDNYVNPHNFLSISDIDQIRDLNKEANIQFQNWVKYTRKHHDPNYIGDTSEIQDPEYVEEHVNDGGNIFWVNGYTGNKQPLIPVPEGEFRPENITMFNLLQRMIDLISGVTDPLKGIASTKEQSASEVAILAESSHTRTRQQVRNLEKTIKRITYILVRMFQQYLDAPEFMHIQNTKTGTTDYQMLGNSKAQAESIMNPGEEVVAKGDKYFKTPPEERNTLGGPKLPEEDETAYRDYKEFIKEYGKEDPVYFDFDIEVESDSSLPLDKQSKANLMMNLANIHFSPDSAIDRLALLTTLQVPNAEEINQRLEQREQEAKQPPPPPPGQPPTGGM